MLVQYKRCGTVPNHADHSSVREICDTMCNETVPNLFTIKNKMPFAFLSFYYQRKPENVQYPRTQQYVSYNFQWNNDKHM